MTFSTIATIANSPCRQCAASVVLSRKPQRFVRVAMAVADIRGVISIH